ncbi:MAG TPA: regulatory protein RecX [Candidatus Acidoferrales bacterium]|nr:regulatory protein RecX [Candidatus Acidoferrales bacterium]
MHRQARKLATEEQLYAAALRALMRRAHSIYEMRQALERRAGDERMIGRVLQRLKNEKLLDDARYARQFARFRAESRRQGRFRIARDLRVRGVPDQHIEAALNELCSETDEAGLVRRRLQRRLKLLRGPLDERQLASLYRSLIRAGFPSDIVRAELRAVSRQDVQALADTLSPEEE